MALLHNLGGDGLLLGLTGLKQSGKDTVGAYLMKEYSFERRAFADKLKQSVAALLNINYADIEIWKNDPDANVILETRATVHVIPFREFLQRYGHESHREIFGRNFWVDQLLPVDGYYAGRAIVVTDCRYREEFDRIKTLGGYMIRVTRKGAPPDKNPHSSELEQAELPVDFTIKNDGTFEELEEQIEGVLNQLA